MAEIAVQVYQGLTLWFLMLCAALWQPSAQADEPLHFISAQTWAITDYGYTPPPYSVNPADLHGTWQTVGLPHALRPLLIPTHINDDPLKPLTVVTWYRLQVPELPHTIAPRYLYIPRWKTDGQIAIYGDSHLLYQSHASMAWNGWNTPLWVPLDETAGTVTPHAIFIRIERPRSSGGGISSIWLGEKDALSWRYHLRYLLQVQLPFMSSAAFLSVGLFSLFVWFKQRHERLYVLFFCVSLVAYLRSMHYYLGTERLPVPDAWFSWLTINSLFWLVALVHVFLNYLHGRPQQWLNRLVAGITLAVGLLTLPWLSMLKNAYVIASLAYLLLLIMGATIALVGWRNSRLAKSRDGLLLAAWGVMGMLFGMYDWLLQNNYVSIESIYLGPYSNISAYVIFMIILFRRYIGAIETIKQQNFDLEIQLQAQHAELQESHRRLREIEQRQMLARERQRIVQDMHDGLGSSLISALRVVEHGQLNETEIVQVLKGCIDDLKLSIDSMEPVEADLLLLLATLRFRLGPRLESTGIALRWAVVTVPALDWLDPRNSLHILRILQEAFTNIIKHTQATEISVSTAVDGDFVLVTICDNGQGFSVEHALKNGGKGLSNQMRRAESIGAEINIDSGHAGTCVTLRLPINQPV
ncbi:MAG: sensor histidine kinase [Sulfuriferula sp.]|nr:sensor histidine kinase [Sulfuriferula sp.]